MKNIDLGLKKMNNKQSINDDSMAFENDNKTKSLLHSELEIDEKGTEKTVDRSRNNNPNDEISKSQTNKKVSSKPSLASEALGKLMVENQDRNSDIIGNRLTISENDDME